MVTLTGASLFSGIGGIDVAMAAAGVDILAQVEIDDYCRKVLSKHAPIYWPNARQFTDIRTVDGADIGDVDILFGGFPCQDISAASPNGRGLEGERSGLWREFKRLIGEIRPRAVLLENVPNITIRGGLQVIADLTSLGYDARWGVVSAFDAGATHKRERWWCVAYPSGYGRRQPNPDERFIQNKRRFNQTEIQGDKQFCTAFSNGQMVRTEGRELGDHNSVGCREGGDCREERHVSSDIGRHVAENQWTGDRGQRGAKSNSEVLGNVGSVGLETRQNQSSGVQQAQKPDRARNGASPSARHEYTAEPRLVRATDGVSDWLDGHRFPSGPNQRQYSWEAPRLAVSRAYRKERIKALGNAVVPQVVYPIALAIVAMLKEQDER